MRGTTKDHPTKNIPWTAAEDRTLKDGRDRGMTFHAISVMLGRSVYSIKARVARMGYRQRTRPVISNEDKIAIRRARWVDGEKPQGIALRYGISVTQVYECTKSVPSPTNAQPVTLTKRACLHCGRPFLSEGKGNRICSPCKRTGEWVFGEWLFGRSGAGNVGYGVRHQSGE